MSTKDKVGIADGCDAMVERGAGITEESGVKGKFFAQCFDELGTLKWEDFIDNLVVTVGKNDILDKYFAGAGYTAAIYMGLISSVSFNTIVAGDTMGSHAGWFEAATANQPTYSQANRPTVTFNAAAAGNKASNGAVTFSMTGNGTAKGCFMTTNNTKDGTTGILVSAGLFSGGDKVVQSGDTLNVTWQIGLT